MGFRAIVVGSGPSGISCAAALLSAGHSVTMLDGGYRLEASQAARLEKLKAGDPSEWRRNPAADFLREHIAADVDGIPLKRAYGSDFPYRSARGATAIRCLGTHTQPSLALGGLSNVWGAVMLPYRQRDMLGWPISEAELAPHYRAVLERVPLTGREDSIASVFPLYGQPHELPVSDQARKLLNRAKRNAEGLAGKKILIGASRIAVANPAERPCAACGLCMYGCPRELIYSSAVEMERMRANERFAWRPGVYVQRVGRKGAGASISGFEIESNQPFACEADRIFLACGPVATTALLLRSLEAYAKPVRMADSQYFLQPCLMTEGTRHVTRENLHTLAQAFVEILDEGISPYTIHLQLYTYNELFAQAVLRAAGLLRHMLPKEMLLGRLILLQGYLHSSESAEMICTLDKTEAGDTLRIEAGGNPHTAAVIQKVQNKLIAAARLTGFMPIPPLLRPGEPGRGYHSGGTFPMSDSPGGFQTDREGALPALPHVHVVDSTVFPSVAATTITLTAMANAHRIGTVVGGA